jgi:hypothetical protein
MKYKGFWEGKIRLNFDAEFDKNEKGIRPFDEFKQLIEQFDGYLMKLMIDEVMDEEEGTIELTDVDYNVYYEEGEDE